MIIRCSGKKEGSSECSFNWTWFIMMNNIINSGSFCLTWTRAAFCRHEDGWRVWWWSYCLCNSERLFFTPVDPLWNVVENHAESVRIYFGKYYVSAEIQLNGNRGALKECEKKIHSPWRWWYRSADDVSLVFLLNSQSCRRLDKQRKTIETSSSLL